jgi:SAM-dependent methyltransferase
MDEIIISDYVVNFLKKNIPFTYIWELKYLSGSPKTVLDIGCGEGKIMGLIKQDSWKVVGIDIHGEAVRKAKKSGVYDEVFQGDLVKTLEKLVRQKKKYDLVFCSQVIEHITREEGNKLLDLSDKLAKKRIYMGTPRGFMVQPEEFLGQNPYQKHKSGWSELDFTSRGYTVYGVGFSPVWSERGLARGKTGLSMLVNTMVSYLMSPIIFYVPSLGAGIMAVKEK